MSHFEVVDLTSSDTEDTFTGSGVRNLQERRQKNRTASADDDLAEEGDIIKIAYVGTSSPGTKIDSNPDTTLKRKAEEDSSSSSSALSYFSSSSTWKLQSSTNLKWQPFYVLHSRVINDCFNAKSLQIRDLFSASPSNPLKEVVIVNFMFSFESLAKEMYMLLNGAVPVLMLHGEKDTQGYWANGTKDGPHSNDMLKQAFYSWRFASVDTGIQWGTHHTKMFLIFFEKGVRIVVHSANLLSRDLEDMTNAAFVQDFPLKSESGARAGMTSVMNSSSFSSSDSTSFFSPSKSASATGGASSGYMSNSGCAFGTTLCDYFENYAGKLDTFPEPASVVNKFDANEDMYRIINKLNKDYDFSAAEVTLIPSVPGRHTCAPGSNDAQKYGHLAIRRKLSSLPPSSLVSSSSGSSSSVETRLVLQPSSIGSISADGKYLCEIVDSFTALYKNPDTQPIDANTIATAAWTRSHGIQLVYPTMECVRTSYQGYATGNSIPVSLNNLIDGSKKKGHSEEGKMRGCFAASLCKWDGSAQGRQHVPPHIKSYCQYVVNSAATATAGGGSASENTSLLWFLLTSSNVSQAAWGVFQGHGAKRNFFVKSFEMGVLFCPQDTTTIKRLYSCTPQHPLLGVDIDNNNNENAYAGMGAGHEYGHVHKHRVATAIAKAIPTPVPVPNEEAVNQMSVKDLKEALRLVGLSSQCTLFLEKSEFIALLMKYLATITHNTHTQIGSSCSNVNFVSSSSSSGRSSCIQPDGSLTVQFPIPYCIPPVPYGRGDAPWVTDSGTTVPDRLGNFCDRSYH